MKQFVPTQHAPVGSPAGHGPQASIINNKSDTPTVPSPSTSATGSFVPQTPTIASTSLTFTAPSPFKSAGQLVVIPQVSSAQSVLAPPHSPPEAVHATRVTSVQEEPTQQVPVGSPPPSQPVQSSLSQLNCVQFKKIATPAGPP